MPFDPFVGGQAAINTDSVREATAAVAIGLRVRISQMPAGPSVAEEAAPEHLEWMTREVEAKAHEWPLDKLSRWVGFVQGVLAARGVLCVQAERDATRALFHAAYRDDGIEVPARTERARS